MGKGRKPGDERIEAVFAQIGLGGFDAEKIEELRETYDRTMETVDRIKSRGKKGKKFGEVLEEAAAPPATDKQAATTGKKR